MLFCRRCLVYWTVVWFYRQFSVCFCGRFMIGGVFGGFAPFVGCLGLVGWFGSFIKGFLVFSLYVV